MNANPSDKARSGVVSPWLASLAMKRGGLDLPRFAYYYNKLARLPQSWRRRLRRKLAVTLGGAALLLALAGPVAMAEPAAPAATITVVNGEVADIKNGRCSLIEAIINARATGTGNQRADCVKGNTTGPDTINLPANGQFVLTAVHNDVYGPTGLPLIQNSTVTINGNQSTIRRDGSTNTPDFRILAIAAGGELNLKNTTISGGKIVLGGTYEEQLNEKGSGGGILNLGHLNVEGSTIINNYVAGGYVRSGGGLDNSGFATLVNSTISGNHAYGYNKGRGGGVINRGEMTITNSVIKHNNVYSYRSGQGGGIHNEGTLTVDTTHIEANEAADYYNGVGGGIRNNGSLTIRNSTISSNGSTVTGGIDNVGSLSITDSVISNNSAYYTGGVSNWGDLTIDNSTIAHNSAIYVGGLYNGSLGIATITRTTISANEGDLLGSGIDNIGWLAIINSTISGNMTEEGGGVTNSNYLTVLNSTISMNYSESSGGGIDNFCRWSPQVTMTLKGSIVSGNQVISYGAGSESSEISVGHSQPDCSTSQVVLNGFNIIGHSGDAGLHNLAPGPTDIVPSVGLNAILSPLSNNGGPTLTHALPAGSPALDHVPNADCTAAPINGIDQRGEPRNQNGSGGASANECDAGAFERAGAGSQMGFFLSSATAGSVGGVTFAPGDIIKFIPGQGWSMHFDASDVGITKNVSAFEIQNDDSILFALVAAQNVPGVGSVAPQDVVRFIPTTTGNTTGGTFQMKLDGSNYQFSTTGEKIDALALHGDGRLGISTSGAAAVPKPNGQILKAQDEDAIGFNFDLLRWSELFDGTPITGLAVEDVNAMWINQTTGEMYINILGAFNLGGVTGNGQDIVKLTPSSAPGGYTPSLFWDGSAAGFPVQIDGLEMIP